MEFLYFAFRLSYCPKGDLPILKQAGMGIISYTTDDTNMGPELLS